MNLEIEKPEYLLNLTFLRPDSVPVLVLSYMCKLKNGEVDISQEPDTIDFAWVSLDDLKRYDLIDRITEEIQMVDKILKAR